MRAAPGDAPYRLSQSGDGGRVRSAADLVNLWVNQGRPFFARLGVGEKNGRRD